MSPGFFASLGVLLIAGRDFNDLDRKDAEPVVIVSQSVAQRLFPGRDAVNRRVMWTDPVMKFIDISTEPRRIVGVAADVDDEHVVPGPALTVYHPFQQQLWGSRLFIHTHSDPYALVSPITRIVRDLAADQPVERASTLEDVRAEVLTPDRLNVVVFGVFAAVALAIAVVGVAGVEARLEANPHAFLVIIAGILLVLPGFITDAIGAVLLLSPIRNWCGRRFRASGRRSDEAVIDLNESEWRQVPEGKLEDRRGPSDR